MSGQALKQMALQAGLGTVAICHEAGISDTTLAKVYRDEPVKEITRVKVEQAIKRLAAKAQAVAV